MTAKSLLVALFLGTAATYAQPPDTLWTKTFGGSNNDRAYSVQQTSDNGYILTGETWSYGSGINDVYLIKTDADGNQSWSHTYGDDIIACGNCVQQTLDGGYIITGHTYGPGEIDVYLVKTDPNGNESWSRTFGGIGGDVGYSVQQTEDRGYIIVGYTDFGGYNVWLIKTDINGNQNWNRTFGGVSDDCGRSVQQTSDRGYIIAGYTHSFGSGDYDVYLIKTDPSGNEIWHRTFGGLDDDQGYCVQQTLDGGYIIAGYTASYGSGSYDVYLIKTDTTGHESWHRTFGGVSNDYGLYVQQTSEGGYIIAGNTVSYGMGSSDVYLIKTDADGNFCWQKTIGGSTLDYGKCVQQTLDGGFIVAGSTDSYGSEGFDAYLLKIYGDNYTPTIEIVTSPINPPIIIPANGSSFQYNLTVHNLGTLIQTFHVWNKVQLPNGNLYGPVLRPAYRSLPGGAEISRQYTQNVPGHTPPGEYLYISYVGIYPNTISDSSFFPFTKEAINAGDQLIGDWNCVEISSADIGTQFIAPSHPQEFILYGATPNPFNPTTTLTFTLPQAARVTLDVFDVNRRRVGVGLDPTRLQGARSAPLQQTWYPAGTHSISFDGSGLPSGVYIYRLTAGKCAAVGKMVLLK